VNEPDRPTALSVGHDDDLASQLWSFSELVTDDDLSVTELAAGLTSVGFIRAALRRSARLWCGTALLGLLIGIGVFKSSPPSFQASTSVLLGNNPFEVPGAAVLDAQAMIESRTVAADALRKLGIKEDPGLFIPDYTVAVLTNRILTITVKATSAEAAIKEANALAAAFLAFQTQQLLNQERLVNASMQEQVAAAQQHVDSLGRQVSALSASGHSPRLAHLTAEHGQAVAELQELKQASLGNEANTKIQTTTLIKGSQVLDAAAPLPQHLKRYLLLYTGAGLIGGLALGLFIVVIRALVSDRLRRRDDISRALGAPVRLSVGSTGLSRWRPGGRGLAAAQGTAIRRVVAHLEHTVPATPGGPASLAVIPADDLRVPATCLVSLALSCAQRGLRVVLADLCEGSPAGQLLNTAKPGIHEVTAHDARVQVVIPEADDPTPAGPLTRRAGGPLAAACAQADLLLTLAAADPAVGADHLKSWARRAIAIVTAGRSTETRVHAIGEMTRLAGLELAGAVLVAADKRDESLGTRPADQQVTVPSHLG
jgi:capsular polysaccharide biosynthesis protein